MTTHEDDTLPDFEDDAIDQSAAQVAETKKGIAFTQGDFYRQFKYVNNYAIKPQHHGSMAIRN